MDREVAAKLFEATTDDDTKVPEGVTKAIVRAPALSLSLSRAAEHTSQLLSCYSRTDASHPPSPLPADSLSASRGALALIVSRVRGLTLPAYTLSFVLLRTLAAAQR